MRTGKVARIVEITLDDKQFRQAITEYNFSRKKKAMRIERTEMVIEANKVDVRV